jgi:L-lactate dehydrogenase complex protein LldG
MVVPHPRRQPVSPAGDQTAREVILARIRAANSARPASAEAAATEAAATEAAATGVGPRDYLRAHHDPAEHDIVALFAERAADYRAVVERVPEADVSAAIARALSTRALALAAPGRYLIPAGLPAEWIPDGIETAADEPPLSATELDQMAGVITGCAVAIAETGTIILDHGPAQGRRALTLVPDFHLVVVRADQVAADLAEAFARLTPTRPHTLISGPSATSDIELIRVEGVHGPRTLHVLLLAPPTP